MLRVLKTNSALLIYALQLDWRPPRSPTSDESTYSPFNLIFFPALASQIERLTVSLQLRINAWTSTLVYFLSPFFPVVVVRESSFPFLLFPSFSPPLFFLCGGSDTRRQHFPFWCEDWRFARRAIFFFLIFLFPPPFPLSCRKPDRCPRFFPPHPITAFARNHHQDVFSLFLWIPELHRSALFIFFTLPFFPRNW